MIDLKTLKQLITLMKDNDLSELDLQDGQEKVKLKRGPDDSGVLYAPTPGVVPTPGNIPTQVGASASAAGAGEASANKDDGLIKITSPMVGTFYTAASPDLPPYVNVGDQVGQETVVCMVEAMKVFNEIKAETVGRIEKVLVSSGQAVEFGQPLFLVKP